MTLFTLTKKGSSKVLPSFKKPLEGLNDEELLSDFIAGNRLAFDLIVNRFKKRIYDFIYFQIHQNPHDSEDLSQDVFIQLYKGAKDFRGESKLATFLFSIARNLILNYFRSHRRRFTSKTEELDDNLVDINCPSQDAENEKWKSRVINALNELSNEERQIIYLCDNEEFTYHQISKILGIKIGTVRSRIHSARTHLLTKLK